MTLYDRVIVELFRRHKGAEKREFVFSRDELRDIAQGFGETVRNLGDILYSYRGGRRPLPREIAETGNWVIEPAGRGTYVFRKLDRNIYIGFPPDLKETTLLDATPEIVDKYSKGDEQSLLTKIRYNRLIDTFLSITAYHLQSHVRGVVEEAGQIELDDLYLGVDTDGNRYVVPIEAKTADEPLGVIQIASMNAYAAQEFSDLTLRSVAVKSMEDGSLFFAEFTSALDAEGVEVVEYRRYRLVKQE